MSAAITLQWINAASIPADVMAKIDGKQVKSAFLTKHSDNAKRATSKMHRFKPAVSLMEALKWADSNESNDITLVFDGDSSIRFEENQFKALDLEDE